MICIQHFPLLKLRPRPVPWLRLLPLVVLRPDVRQDVGLRLLRDVHRLLQRALPHLHQEHGDGDGHVRFKVRCPKVDTVFSTSAFFIYQSDHQ